MSEHAVVPAPEAPVPGAGSRSASATPGGSLGAPTAPTPAVAPPLSTRGLRASRGRTAAWSMTLSMLALVASWFVLWALPLGVVGVVLAINALAAHRAKRQLAWWGLGLGLGSILCSAFWIVWALQAAAEAAGA